MQCPLQFQLHLTFNGAIVGVIDASDCEELACRVEHDGNLETRLLRHNNWDGWILHKYDLRDPREAFTARICSAEEALDLFDSQAIKHGGPERLTLVRSQIIGSSQNVPAHNGYVIHTAPIRVGSALTDAPYDQWRPPTGIECLQLIGRGRSLVADLRRWLDTFPADGDFRVLREARTYFSELQDGISRWLSDPAVLRATTFTAICRTSIPKQPNGRGYRRAAPTEWLNVLPDDVIAHIDQACGVPVTARDAIDGALVEFHHDVTDEDRRTLIERLVAVARVRAFLERVLLPLQVQDSIPDHLHANTAGFIESCDTTIASLTKHLEPHLGRVPERPPVLQTQMAASRHPNDGMQSVAISDLVIDPELVGVLTAAMRKAETKLTARQRVSAVMNSLFRSDPETYGLWTVEKWVEHCKASSKTVCKTEAWEEIQSWRAANKAERISKARPNANSAIL